MIIPPAPPAPPWTLEAAVDLCRKIEQLAPAAGCHVALTGGCLYKDGARKDLDLLFYRIRQVDQIDYAKLFALLYVLGIEVYASFGWVSKARQGPREIDLFFPEAEDAPGAAEYPF